MVGLANSERSLPTSIDLIPIPPLLNEMGKGDFWEHMIY